MIVRRLRHLISHAAIVITLRPQMEREKTENSGFGFGLALQELPDGLPGILPLI